MDSKKKQKSTRWGRRFSKLSTDSSREVTRKVDIKRTSSSPVSFPGLALRLVTPLPFRRRKTSERSGLKASSSTSLPDLTESASTWETQQGKMRRREAEVQMWKVELETSEATETSQTGEVPQRPERKTTVTRQIEETRREIEEELTWQDREQARRQGEHTEERTVVVDITSQEEENAWQTENKPTQSVEEKQPAEEWLRQTEDPPDSEGESLQTEEGTCLVEDETWKSENETCQTEERAWQAEEETYQSEVGVWQAEEGQGAAGNDGDDDLTDEQDDTEDAPSRLYAGTGEYGSQLGLSNREHALKSLSRSTPAMSPSASPRHSDSEGQPRVSKGTKKFMRHFTEAPPNEWVLNYFACALVSDILLQGTLYITPNFFAFYSKIFGHVSRLLIPVTQVASLQKERTAKIIPNAVGLQMLDGKSYVFGSLLSRDSTFKLMQHIWKKAQRMADSDSEPPSAVQVAAGDDGDDGEDSVSGSAESLMEDHADGFRASADTPLPPIDTPPWPSDEPIINTNSNSNVTSESCTVSQTVPLNSGGVTGSSVTTSSTATLQRGGSKSGAPTPEEPGGTPTGGEGEGLSLLEWFTEGSLVKTCFRMGSMPMKVVGEGVREVWSLPRTSLLLLISTLLLLLLFASAAFMLHRVDLLSQQLGLEKFDEYDTMYEEVLQMQQRLHTAASTEVEKTLSIQLKHIATVRQSLEALMVLFNKEPPSVESAAQIPDHT